MDLQKQNEELVFALKWLFDNHKAVLEGKPVKCADECIVYVENLIKQFE